MGGAGWIRMMSESGPMISGIPAVDFWISCTRTHTPEPPEMQECIENTRGSSAYGRKIGVYLPRDDAHPTVDLDGMPLWWHGADLDGMPLWWTWMECPCGGLGWNALVAAWGGPACGLGWNAPVADLDGIPLWRHGADLDAMPLWQNWMGCP